MSTTLFRPRPHLFGTTSSTLLSRTRRAVSTLPSNPHIYIHDSPSSSSSSSNTSQKTYILSLLPSPPTSATLDLAIGSTPTVPPTPSSLTENPKFLQILHSVLAKHATRDPVVKAAAAAFASSAGASLGGGGALFGANHPSSASKRRQDGRKSIQERLKEQRERNAQQQSSSSPSSQSQSHAHTSSSSPSPSTGAGGGANQGGAGGANYQGGMGSGGRGGWVHVSDLRNPPDYGRIAWPEDIFGSLELDGQGRFVGDGNYQPSGTYRVITREGILGLSAYLREKVVEELRRLEVEGR